MSTDWASGYISDLGYTHGYYGELSPALIDFALLLRGYEPPPRAGMRYLELGFGQGLSINIHAAAAPGEYWGVDVNPMHAANAQALARASGADCRLSDASFHDLAVREDLPDFDYIVLHGIWSWVGDDVRKDICSIIRRRLKVGGVVYISYNALPGWAAAMPLRQILAIHAETAGSDQYGVLGQVEPALAFAKQLVDAEGRYFTANPTAKDRLQQIGSLDRRYVAHEYFNKHWEPMYFADVNEWLADSKLTFAASASLQDQVEAVNFTEAQRRLIAGAGHPVLQETLRDYLQNQQFRRDLFVRGGRQLSALERKERLDEVRLVLTAPPANIPLKANTNLGEMRLKDEVYQPILAALAEDGYRPKTLGELGALPAIQALPPGALLEAVTLLVGLRKVLPAQAPDTAAETSARLASHLLDRARSGGDLTYLPSPVAGAGVVANRLEQLFLLAREAGGTTPEAWADAAWAVLRSQNQRVLKDGKAVEADEDNVAELRALARTFAADRLPVLTALGVASAQA